MNTNYKSVNDFHVFLSSNDKSCSTFATNEQGNFSNLLVHPLEMKKKMKVGLMSYSFTNNFFNYIDPRDRIMIFDALHEFKPGVYPNLSKTTKYGKMHQLKIPSAFYSTPAEFADVLQKSVDSLNIS